MKRILCLLMVAMLAFAVLGCGSSSNGADDPDNGDNGSTGGNGDPVDEAPVTGDFYEFGSILDIAQEFQELGCTFFEDEVDYFFLGKENVDGVQAEHIRVLADGQQLDIWIDDNEEVIKGTVDGEDADLIMVNAVADIYFSLLELFYTEQGWDESWDGAEHSTVTRDLGAGAVTATRLDWTAPWLPFNYEIEVAKIAGRNLRIRFWQVTDEGQDMGGWYLRRAIPR